jgi:hypothetical protein
MRCRAKAAINEMTDRPANGGQVDQPPGRIIPQRPVGRCWYRRLVQKRALITMRMIHREVGFRASRRPLLAD